MIFRWLPRLTLFALAVTFAVGLAHADPQVDPRPFRRIYVPADRPQEWPTDNERYLPIDREEFSRLLDDASAGQQAAPGVLAARVARADYSARVEDGDLLVGRAILEIIHNSAEPALLPLEPWSVAVVSARWHAVDAAQSPPSDEGVPAVIGNTPEGEYAVLVSRSGRLIVEWTLRGQRNLSGTVGFALRLPQTPASQLMLDAPADVVPELDRALVAELPQPAATTRRWKLDTGGRTVGGLRLTTRDTNGQRRDLTLLRQSDTYQISSQGVDLTTSLQIDAHGDPLSRITLQVDPALQVVDVRQGPAKLSWTVATDSQTKLTQARIELPEAIVGVGEPIQVTSIASVTTGQLWRLPRLRCEDVFWQEGNITLNVRSPLELGRLEAKGARQSKSAPSVTSPGETIEVQCFSPDATLEIDVRRPDDRLRVASGTRLEFFSGEIVAHVVADFQVAQGRLGALSCKVDPLWQIDAVEAAAPATVSDWDIEGVDPDRRLVVRLTEPALKGSALRLNVTGRRVLSLNDAMSVRELRMLGFNQIEQSAPLMLLHDPEMFDLQTTGSDELTRVDLTKLIANSPLHADPMPSGLAFEVNSSAERLGVKLTPRKPQFSAELDLRAEARRGSLTEQCHIHCRPSGVMDRLLVHVSQAPGDASWQWTADKALGPLATRRLTTDEQLIAGTGSTGQAWEISWRLPQREAFEIRGARTATWTSTTAVTLLATPEATNQSGQMVVRSIDGAGVQIVNRRLAPLPPEGHDPDAYPTVRGTFRFDPTRDGFGGEPALEIAPIESTAEESGAWAWRCDLDSRLSTGGLTAHLAVFRLQTAGQQTVRFSLPPAARLLGAWIDAEPVAQELGSSQTVSVNLPKGRQFATVSLYFVTSESLPKLTASYSPAFPTADVPILSRRWRAWIPGGYKLPTSDIHAHRYTAQSISWTERLFGPLARGLQTGSRNPLHASFWFPGEILSQDLVEAQRLVEPLLEQLGKQTATATASNWGPALTAISAAVTGVDFRVSQNSLDEAQITADTLLPNVGGESALVRGIAMLRRKNLVLLVRGQHVLLASATMAAINHQASHPIADLPAFAITDGPLASDMDADPTAAQPLDFMSVGGWRQASSGRQTRWTLPEIVTSSLAETCGWKAYQFDLSDESSVRVAIQNLPAVYAVATGLLLAVFAAGLCRNAARCRWWLMICGLALAAALLLPVAWRPMPSAVFVGALCSCLWLARRRKVNDVLLAEETDAANSPRRALATASATLLLMGWSWFAAQAGAQEVDTAQQPQSPPIAKVLVPIDDAQRVVGEKFHIPEAFYQLLMQDAARLRALPKAWLIENARYRVGLSREAFQPEGNSLQLRVSFDLKVFARDTIVRIPLSGENLKIAQDGIQIDGRSALVVPGAVNEIAFRIDEPGSKRVEFTVMPTLQLFGTVVGFELNVPAVSCSQVDLSGVEASQVEVPTAHGRIKADKERDRVVAELGETTRLVVRWPQGGGLEGAAPAVDLDELQWAKVQPGSMVIDVRLNLRVSEGRVRQLRLLADPRLRLITPTGGDSPIAAARIVPGELQSIDLDLAKPITDQGVVPLKFVVAGTSGIGNLRLPRCEVVGVRATRRYFAVSVDSGLEFKQEVGDDMQSLAIPEFAAAWGDGDARPQSAFRIARGEVPWSMSTQPKATIAKAEETLMLGIEPRTATVIWQADVNTSAGFASQWHVFAPPELEIGNVRVIGAKDAELPSRWSRDRSDGSLTILLAAPVVGEHRIVVSGSSPHEAQASLPAPKLSLDGAEIGARRLFVFRHPLVLANVSTTGEWQPKADLPSGIDSAGLGTLVDALSTSLTDATAEIRCEPNQPVSTASHLIAITHDGTAWTADVDYRLRVQSGLVDTIAWEIPPQWENPVLADPIPVGATVTIADLPGTSSRRLVVRPAEPIRDEYRVVLRGAIKAPERDRLQVPDIVPLGSTKVERFVLLPKQLELHPIAWDTAGLISAELPAELEASPLLLASHNMYHTPGNRFQASLRLFGQDTSKPKVELADTRIYWDWDGRCYGVASFSVMPSGLQSCLLQMPETFRPVHCRVGGLPVQALPVDGGRWRLPLAHQSPQRVELVFHGELKSLKAAGWDTRIEGPHLIGLEVARTLWTVVGPSQAATGLPVNGSLQASPAQYQTQQMEVAATFDKAGQQLLADDPNGKASMPLPRPSLCALRGNSNVLRLDYRSLPSGNLGSRLAMAIVALVLCAVVGLRKPGKALPTFPTAWIAAALAAAWWIWLVPAYVAALLLAGSLAVALASANAVRYRGG